MLVSSRMINHLDHTSLRARYRKPVTLQSKEKTVSALDASAHRSLLALLMGASSALGNCRCCILKVDEASGEVMGLISSHEHPSPVRRSRFRAERGLAGTIVLKRREAIVEDARCDERFLRLGRGRVSCLIGAPILHRGRVLGVITAVHPRPRAFGRGRLEVLKGFAYVAAQLMAGEGVASREEGLPLHRTEILSAVSHEMRTPLTTISALTSLILTERAGALQPLQREFLTSIQLSARQLNRMAEHILDLYLAEAGQFRIRREPLQIAEVVDDAVRQLKQTALRAGVHLAHEACWDLPLVNGDQRRLDQVVSNVLSMAIRLSPEGGRVNVSVVPVGDELKIAVDADGIWMPPEEQEQVFEALCGTGTAIKRASNWLSLGLRVSKLVIEHHDGRIWAEARAGKGARFCFSLPLYGL